MPGPSARHGGIVLGSLLLAALGTELGPGKLDVTMPISLTGNNLPVTTGIGLGYRVLWGG